MENNKLLKELNACAIICNMCYNECLNEEDVTVMVRCIELSRECADICQLTTSLLVRDSENIDYYLRICAEICEICAEECEKHENEYCQKCAHVCRTSSEICFALQPVN